MTAPHNSYISEDGLRVKVVYIDIMLDNVTRYYTRARIEARLFADISNQAYHLDENDINDKVLKQYPSLLHRKYNLHIV